MCGWVCNGLSYEDRHPNLPYGMTIATSPLSSTRMLVVVDVRPQLSMGPLRPASLATDVGFALWRLDASDPSEFGDSRSPDPAAPVASANTYVLAMWFHTLQCLHKPFCQLIVWTKHLCWWSILSTASSNASKPFHGAPVGLLWEPTADNL